VSLFDPVGVAIFVAFPNRGLSPTAIQIHPRRGWEMRAECLIQRQWGKGEGEPISYFLLHR